MMDPQAPIALPEDPAMQGNPNDEEDIITLTIKGPIHMAKNTSSQARWIDAVNRSTTTK
jgi:hypothetical protein